MRLMLVMRVMRIIMGIESYEINGDNENENTNNGKKKMTNNEDNSFQYSVRRS